jgi:hypothetical protein
MSTTTEIKVNTERNKLKVHWNLIAVQKLRNKTIATCRYMTDKEMQKLGWSKSPLLIMFTDRTIMYASADDEGNEGGSLFTTIAGLEVIPTI